MFECVVQVILACHEIKRSDYFSSYCCGVDFSYDNFSLLSHILHMERNMDVICYRSRFLRN